MRKITAFCVAATIFALSTFFVGCNTSSNKNIRVSVMKGLTAIGLAHAIHNNSDQALEVSIASEISEVSVGLKQGTIDAAVLPSNAAATLFTKAGIDIVAQAITVENGLYIMESGNSVSGFASLNGKKIVASGKGAVPEYVLRAVLAHNNVSCEIDLYQTPAEVIAQMKLGNTIALLPKPFTYVAETQIDGLRCALDLGEEFSRLEIGTEIITAVLVARREFLLQNEDTFSSFMRVYDESVRFMTASDNAETAAEYTLSLEVVPSIEIARKLFADNTGITLKTDNLKFKLESFFNLLHEFNPASIGGEMPQDSFYAI